MRKLLLQLIVFIGVFLALWIVLSKLPLEKWFHVKEIREKKQADLSKIIFRVYSNGKLEIEDDSVHTIMNGLRNRLCLASNIDTASIHIHVFEDDEINAFAIPGGNIIVNTALINDCDNADMLAGVIGHEIGHIENGHISKRLAAETGLSAILMIGGDNMGIIKQVIKTLTSSKFSRSQESEADMASLQYMQNAHIDARQTAYFFKKLAEKKDYPSALKWIGSHPMPEERAETILKKAIKKGNYLPALDSMQWHVLKQLAADN